MNISSGNPRISLRDVAQTYGGKLTVMEGLSLDIESGEFVAIVGPSGCGKTSIINMIAGFIKPSSGTVSYDGTAVNGPNTHVGYVAQDDQLLTWRTVRRNIALPLEFRHRRRSEVRARVHELVERVGLSGFEDYYPAQLSGGMRQRVAIARALASNPETLLMDEPFGKLDAQLRIVMHQDLLRVFDEQRITVVFVTHDLTEAISLADRVVVLGGSPAGIRRIEAIDDLGRPRDVVKAQSSAQLRQHLERLWSEFDRVTV